MKSTRYLTIGLMSVTLIALELVWTRIFSAEYFYTFAFLILSLAIMGLGLGALALRLFAFLDRDATLGLSLSLSGLLALIGPPLVILLGIDFSAMFTSWTMIARLVLVVLILSSSFFFGGIALAMLFKKNHQDMPNLYMADLLGAGLGVLVVILLMNSIGTPLAAFLVALPILLAAVIASHKLLKITPLLFIVLVFWMAPRADSLLEVEREERAPVIYKHWDAMAKIKMYDFGGYYRGLNIDNVANSPVIPFDGDWSAEDTVESEWDINVKNLVDRFDSCVFLSLGAGGGADVLQALDHHAAEVHAVEVNPHINYMLTHGDTSGYIDWPEQDEDSSALAAGDSTAARAQQPPRPNFRDSTGRIIACPEYTGNIYNDPRVTVVSEDARTYIKRFRNKFDVIYSLSSNTWAALGSGAFALAENYIFTTEAFIDYWRALSDSGFLSMEHQVYMPRLVTEVIDALDRLGVENPKDHFAVYNIPGMRRKLLLLSKQPLTGELLATAYGPLQTGQRSDKYLLYPAPDSLKDNIYNRIILNGWQSIEDSAAAVDLSPCTDNRPFIAQMGMMKNFAWDKLDRVNLYSDFTGFPLSKIIMLIILIVVIVLVVPLNLVPYLKKGEMLGGVPWLYFFTIGVAFMGLEIVLIQKYALFIGASVYSIAAVLLTLLIASGIGSRFSNKVSDSLPFLAICGWILLDIFLLGHLTGALSGLGILSRTIVTAVLIFPLGFFMGMPFPKAALRVGPLIDWGFAVNGAASVLGSIIILLIAMSYGFNVALIFGAILYLFALLLISGKRSWQS